MRVKKHYRNQIWGGLGFCTSFGTNFDAELGRYKDFLLSTGNINEKRHECMSEKTKEVG